MAGWLDGTPVPCGWLSSIQFLMDAMGNWVKFESSRGWWVEKMSSTFEYAQHTCCTTDADNITYNNEDERKHKRLSNTIQWDYKGE